MIIEGEHKENCLFAGLAIYQGLREDILFCSNRSFWNNNTADRRKDANHTIAPSDDINLVIYAIKNYTTIFASLTFILSTCDGVAINPCEYEVYCGSTSSTLAVCNSYLDSLATATSQFKHEIQNIAIFESLHKIRFNYLSSSSLTQKTNSCLKIYFSSAVKARKQKIFQDRRYHQYFSGTSCFVVIIPEIGSLKNEMENWALYSTYVGVINRLESFQVLGMGKIITKHLDKHTQKQEKYTKIIIEEKDFHTFYKVTVKDDVTLRVKTLSGIAHNKDTKLTKIFFCLQGGSYSSLLVSLSVRQLELLGIISPLTSWHTSLNYIVPLINIDTRDKTKQLLNILTNFYSVSFGYLLHLTIKENSFSSLTNNAIVATLKIQTKFCIRKCLAEIVPKRIISDLKKCNTLISNDMSDTRGLFKEMYGDYCTTNSTLDWSMDVYAPDLFKSRGLEVLLPGIYENVEVHIYYHNYSINTNKGMLKIEWQDKKIMQRVNTSLLLNGKQYYIFPENINQGKVFSWNEAKKLCIKYESNLPILNSQSDIEDLVDVIVRAAWAGPIRMIFIGLQVSRKVYIFNQEEFR